MRARVPTLLACLAVATALTVPARAETRAGGFPARRGFLDEGPATLQLVGTVVRHRNAIPFYTLAYYVDLRELRRAIGPGRRSLQELAQVLIQGRIAQGYVTRFEQGIGKERRVDFLLENLEQYWEGGGFRRDAPALRSFLPFFDAALERGEETQVWIHRGVIFTRKPGLRANRTEDPELCRAFANSYLGDLRKPGADRILREDLLRQLPALLERVR